MARIPRYVSRAQAVSQSGVVALPDAPVPDFQGRAFMQLGNEMGKISDKLFKAAEDDAVGNAHLNATLKLNDLEMELQTEDPMFAMSIYDSRANAIIEESSKNLSRNAKARFSSEIRRQFAASKIAVQKDGITRGRQKLEANLVTRIAGLAKSARPGDSDEKYSERVVEAEQAIHEAVANRVIAADRGARIFQKYLNDADNARASFDMHNNPSQFIKDLTSEDKFIHLTGEQRSKWRTKADNEIKRRQKEEDDERVAAEKKAEREIKKIIQILDGGAELNSQFEEVLDPDNIRKRIADEDKAEKIIALTNDAVVFYNVRNSLSEMDTPALMAIADRFVSEAEVTVKFADLRIQNQKQRDIILKEIEKSVDSRGKAYLKNLKSALTAEERLLDGETLSDKHRETLALSSVPQNIANKEDVIAVKKMIVDQRAHIVTMKNLDKMSKSEQTEELEAARGELSQASAFAQEREQRQFNALKDAIEKIQKLRESDPVRAAMGSSSVADAYSRFQQNPTAENYADYAAKRDNQMNLFGIPSFHQKLLSNEEAKVQANVFNSLALDNPEQASDQMQSLQEIYDEDWPRVLKEMYDQGLNKSAGVLMHVDDPILRDALTVIIRNGGLPSLRADKTPFPLRDFDRFLGEKMASVENAAQDQGRLMTRSLRDAVEMFARSGIQSGTYKSVTDAIDDAYDKVVGQNYDVVDHDYLHGIVPRNVMEGFELNRAAIGLRAWLEANRDITFSPVHLQAQMRPGMTPDQIKEQTFELIQSNATWQLSPDGSEAILQHNQRPVADANNNIIRVSIDEALAFSSVPDLFPMSRRARTRAAERKGVSTLPRTSRSRTNLGEFPD